MAIDSTSKDRKWACLTAKIKEVVLEIGAFGARILCLLLNAVQALYCFEHNSFDVDGARDKVTILARKGVTSAVAKAGQVNDKDMTRVLQ